ncbi:MAG: CopG family antitoxin [Moorellales bacterium]
MRRRKLPEYKGDQIPDFASEEEEREFWDSHSFAEAMEGGVLAPPEEPIEAAPELAHRLSTRRVTLRLQAPLVEAAKEIARTKGVRYQTLLRSWIAEAILKEQTKHR